MFFYSVICRHCAERSDEAIRASIRCAMDCFRLRQGFGGQVASLAMTENSRILGLLGIPSADSVSNCDASRVHMGSAFTLENESGTNRGRIADSTKFPVSFTQHLALKDLSRTRSSLSRLHKRRFDDEILKVFACGESNQKRQRVNRDSESSICLRHSGMVRRTRPQMRNCASGNLEIPGSMLRIAPE